MISDMDQSPLKHWPPPKGAIHYFRKNRRTELNSLSQVTAATPSASTAITPEAIVTISFYSQPTKGSNRNESWVNGFILDAVCAFPASQTLQTVFEHLSCTTEDNSTQGLESLSYGGNEVERGLYGIVLENTVFGGGVGNWAHQFQQVCNTSQCESQVANNTMSQTKLLDLRLKVQHPYWIYHKGNCIHCWLVEGVRLASSTDINCPMMLHKGTRPHPTCHHCGRNPVTLAVNGDTRLGESPSRICGECWDAMGGRQNNDSVVIHLALSTIERPLV
ncbi:hypothetical protein FRC20_007981 [Serendipita sp. 405]|nr:hypothetical protein FRC20_007981 [Serendipita sp. 405]